MLKFYQNKMTGALVALNTETKEISEFEEIGEKTAEPLRGGGELSERKTLHPDRATLKKDKKDQHCSSCGRPRAKGKYFCKGMCATCYSREIYRKKHGGKEKVKSESRVNEYECIDCGAEVKSTLDINQVKCPKNTGHTLVQR